jgi:putative endonuclease
MKNHNYYVYILTNKHHNVLYIGVTNDLARRIWEHKNHVVKGFTAHYNVETLVYYEHFSDIILAIGREKQLKNWKREWKDQRINEFNPGWEDLYDRIC